MTMRLLFSILIAGFIGAGIGCSDKPAAPAKPATQKAAAAPAVAPKAEEKIEQQTYDYNAKGRRDPFQSLVEVAKAKPRKVGNKPIENFDVDEIRLTAIIWNNRDNYALITLPDGKSYTLRKGMTLGLYGGKVVDITREEVLIREQVKDFRGQTKMKDTLLKLRKEGVE
jgi:type IV pilus assembly protein PilP